MSPLTGPKQSSMCKPLFVASLVATVFATLAGIADAETLAAAVLPSSRAVQVGATATAFATIINAVAQTATGCAVALKRFVLTQAYRLKDHARLWRRARGDRTSTSRHSFATHLLGQGAPITYVAAQLGQAKPTTTLTYYAHWIPSGDKRHIDRFEAIRQAVSSPEKGAGGSKTVAPDSGCAPEAPDTEWSRGRELNPRPTDYESQGRDPCGVRSFPQVCVSPHFHANRLTTCYALARCRTLAAVYTASTRERSDAEAHAATRRPGNSTRHGAALSPGHPRAGAGSARDERQRQDLGLGGPRARTGPAHHPRAASCAVSLAVARDQALAMAAAVARGEDPAAARARERGELTFGGLAELYFERHARPRKRSAGQDERMLRDVLGRPGKEPALIPATWRHRRLSDLTREDVAELHARVGRDSGHYAANRGLALLRAMFNLARIWGLCLRRQPGHGHPRSSAKSDAIAS